MTLGIMILNKMTISITKICETLKNATLNIMTLDVGV
jgi:hypothetical protein